MRPRSIITLLLIPTFAGILIAEESRRMRTVNKVSLDFTDHLDGPAKWEVGGKDTVSLKMDGDSTAFLDGGEDEIFRLEPPEYISEVISSEDRSSLALIAMESRGFGSDFAALILIQHTGPDLKVSRALESGYELFDGDRWWLSELGAISNDGATLLAKFGVSHPAEGGGFRMSYKWYTLDLAKRTILSEGLTIANSKSHLKQ